jgi:oxygen-dependent protoporphyrinogen oxidase
VGGATDPLTASLSSSSLAGLAHGELSPLLGINGQPAISRVTAYERAIPQYNLGHIARLACIQEVVAGIPGLHLTGNYFSGPAIGACAEHAQAVAEAMRMG